MSIFNKKTVLVQTIRFLAVTTIKLQTTGASGIPNSNPKCTASPFSSVLPPSNSIVLSIIFNEANSSYQDPTILSYDQQVTFQLPAYCSVLRHVVPSSIPSFLFPAWLPDTTWNQRILMVGIRVLAVD